MELCIQITHIFDNEYSAKFLNILDGFKEQVLGTISDNCFSVKKNRSRIFSVRRYN